MVLALYGRRHSGHTAIFLACAAGGPAPASFSDTVDSTSAKPLRALTQPFISTLHLQPDCDILVIRVLGINLLQLSARTFGLSLLFVD